MLFRALLKLPTFNPRFLHPLLKHACETLRAEAQHASCEHQWRFRSETPLQVDEDKTQSLVNCGHLVLITKQFIINRAEELLTEQEHMSSQVWILSEEITHIMRAVGKLAELSSTFSTTHQIMEWQPLYSESGELDFNKEVHAALSISSKEAILLIHFSEFLMKHIANHLDRPNTMITLWPILSCLEAISKLASNQTIASQLYNSTYTHLSPVGVRFCTVTINVAYHLLRYTTLSFVPPSPKDPVSNQKLHDLLRVQNDCTNHIATNFQNDSTEPNQYEMDASGLSVLSMHQLCLLVKESMQVLDPQRKRHLVKEENVHLSVLPLCLQLCLNRVTKSIAPLVMSSLQQYALCCNPSTYQPSSHIEGFLNELQLQEGIELRQQLLEDEAVAQELMQRVFVIGINNSSEKSLQLIWTWLCDIVEASISDVGSSIFTTTTIISAIRTLTAILNSMCNNVADDTFPTFLTVESMASSYLETVAGLYLHRTNLIQRFDYLTAHYETWHKLGRSVTSLSANDIVVC